jgi:hypothetical protein
VQTHLSHLRQQAGLVLEAQRAGEVGERALDYWRGGGLRGVAAAAAVERGRAPSGGAGEGEMRRAVGTGEVSGSRKPGTGEVLGNCVWKDFRVSNGPWAGLAAQGTKSTTSRLKKSSCQLVGRLVRKVESDSPVGILGAPGRLVADLKTRIRITNYQSFIAIFLICKLSTSSTDTSSTNLYLSYATGSYYLSHHLA